VGREKTGDIVGYLLENLEYISEGKIMNIYFLFNDLKCGINQNIMWLFEIQKPSPKKRHHIINKYHGCDQ